MSFKFTEINSFRSLGIVEVTASKENPHFKYPNDFYEAIKKTTQERLNRLEIPVKVHYSNRREKDVVVGFVEDFTSSGVFRLHLLNMTSSKRVVEALKEHKTKLYMLGTGSFIEDSVVIDSASYRLEEVYFTLDSKDKK